MTMLPFRQAIKLPIILTRNVRFYNLSGKVIIDGVIKPGIIRFGFFGEDNMYWNSQKTLLKIEGVLKLEPDVHIGNGVIIRVENGAVLSIAADTRISNNVKIICYDSITIKSNNRIAWECQIIDTSFHYIVNKDTKEYAPLNKPIVIGQNNWIGNRVSVMKGAETPDYCIVASGSLINKKMDVPSYSLIGGEPAKLIKTGIYRALIEEEADIKKKERR